MHGVSASPLKFCSVLYEARCASITKDAFPFRGQNATFFALLDSPRLARRAGLLTALYNFPLVSRSGSLCGRLAGFSWDPLSRLHLERRERPRGLTLSAFTSRPLHIRFMLYCPRHYLKRFQVARQSAVRVVAPFERLPGHYRDKKESRVSRYPLRMCAARENRHSCAYIAYKPGTLRACGRGGFACIIRARFRVSDEKRSLLPHFLSLSPENETRYNERRVKI